MPSTYDDVIDGISTSVAVKAPCRVATTANITRSGLQTIDDVVLVADDRVLVKDQTNAEENGIYVASATTWARARDFDGARDAVRGTVVYVVSGTANGNKFFQLTTADPVIGTSDLAFSAVGVSLGNVSAFMQTVLDDTTSNAALTTLTATRAEAGAVAVPVLTKLRENVSLADFGAAGDGTTDDAPALTNAVAAAFSGTGVLEVKKATYKLSSLVTAAPGTTPNVNNSLLIVCEHGTKFLYDVDLGAFHFDGTNQRDNSGAFKNSGIVGAQIEPFSGQVAGTAWAVTFTKCNKAIFERNNIRGDSAKANGLRIVDVWDAQVSNNYMDEFKTGVQCEGDTNFAKIVFNEIVNCTTSAVRSPVGAACDANFVMLNYIEGNADAIALLSSGDRLWRVESNFLNANTGGTDIYLVGNDSIIAGNHIANSEATTNIKVENDLNTISGNVLTGTPTGTDYAIRLHTNADGNFVSGNRIIAAPSGGSIIDASTNQNNIIDNNFGPGPEIITNCPSFSVHKNGTNQTGIVTGTWTKLTWSAERFDNGGRFAADGWTPGRIGNAQLSARAGWDSLTAGAAAGIAIYRNGSAILESYTCSGGSANPGVDAGYIGATVDVGATTDVFEIYVLQNSGSNKDIAGVANVTWFTGYMLD